MKHIISINDFSKKDLEEILSHAKEMYDYLEKKDVPPLLSGKIMASLFFEPSTRTRLSFEAAIQRLGGTVIGFSDPKSTSLKKRETTADTIKMAAAYSDVIVMRHPNPGSAKLASEVSTVPIINGGDGSHQHPTQTMLDLFTIQKEKGTLENLNIAFVGDLKYGRTVHSLVTALNLFENKFKFISPKELKMPKEYCLGKYEETNELSIEDADVIYVTRVQEERFPDPLDYGKVKGTFVLNKKTMGKAKQDCIVMHALPRVDEISWEIDNDPRTVYFKQAEYGVATRMALLSMALEAI